MRAMTRSAAPIPMPAFAPVDGDEDLGLVDSGVVLVEDEIGVICGVVLGTSEDVAEDVDEVAVEDEVEEEGAACLSF